jgi:hypothetical protein
MVREGLQRSTRWVRRIIVTKDNVIFPTMVVSIEIFLNNTALVFDELFEVKDRTVPELYRAEKKGNISVFSVDVSEYEETKEWVEMAVSNTMTYLSILKTDLLKRSQSALNAPQGFSFPLPFYKDHVVHFAVEFFPSELPISMLENPVFYG